MHALRFASLALSAALCLGLGGCFNTPNSGGPTSDLPATDDNGGTGGLDSGTSGESPGAGSTGGGNGGSTSGDGADAGVVNEGDGGLPFDAAVPPAEAGIEGGVDAGEGGVSCDRDASVVGCAEPDAGDGSVSDAGP